MKIEIPVNHNYYEEKPIKESSLTEDFKCKESDVVQLKQIFSSFHEIKIGDKLLDNVKLISFKSRPFETDLKRLVIKLYGKEVFGNEKEYIVQTGLYAGKLYYQGCEFNITSGYDNAFMIRMLNFANDIYVDTGKTQAKDQNKANQFLFIISYLFTQSLKKASVLGLPQHYVMHKERSHKVRGPIDFNEYLIRDVPFQGKLTSKFRERQYVQEIVDVLYFALLKQEKLFKQTQSSFTDIKRQLRQYYSGKPPTNLTIRKAKQHNVLYNPMFGNYKKVLEYAEILILENDLTPNKDSEKTIHGFLIDIAELFELYLERLLAKHFSEWKVNSQDEMNIYSNHFYKRTFFPDLVMRHRNENKIVVFDAKFKKMNKCPSDVDRNDIHQIHSYSGFYGGSIIASGLIYPFSKKIRDSYTYPLLYGHSENQPTFIIDGVEVENVDSIEKLIENEKKFINRISVVIN